ncbi:MAG: stage III sporulation protein AA, partial [Oscillospiraceae bacterium]
MPDGYENAVRLLPETLRAAALRLPGREKAEEIRLRRGRAPTALLPEGERPLAPGLVVEEKDVAAVLEAATRSSLHAARDELRRGYLTARGGVRVGVCGTAVMGEGVETLRDF